MDVLYTVDHKYVKHMLSSMYSLVESNPDIYLNVHIIEDKFDKHDYELLDYVVGLLDNPKLNVKLYDFKEIEKEIEKYEMPNWKGSRMANARIFFSKEIKNASHLLYLDSDTYVVNRVIGLNQHFGPISMVKDDMSMVKMKEIYPGLKHYFNSGVIWINVDKWMELDFDKRIADTLKNRKVEFEFPDQDALNIAFKDDIEVLPPEYNMLSSAYYYNKFFLSRYYKGTDIEKYPMDEMQEAKKSPIILHGTPLFVGKKYTLVHDLHPYHKYYEEYQSRLFGKDFPNEELSFGEKVVANTGLHVKALVPKKARVKIKEFMGVHE